MMNAFHEIHGSNLWLSDDQRTAVLLGENEAVFGHNILFSEEPLEPGRKFAFRVNAAVRRAGWLNLGLTSRNPGEMELLPRWARELPDAWLQDGHTLYRDGEPLEQFDTRVEVEPGDRVAVHLTKDGDLRFIINDVDKRLVFEDLPTYRRLWVVIVPAWIRSVSTDAGEKVVKWRPEQTTDDPGAIEPVVARNPDGKNSKTCVVS